MRRISTLNTRGPFMQRYCGRHKRQENWSIGGSFVGGLEYDASHSSKRLARVDWHVVTFCCR